MKFDGDITTEIKFENTLLRNGIISEKDKQTLANEFDKTVGDNTSDSDSMFDTIISTASSFSSDNHATRDTFESELNKNNRDTTFESELIKVTANNSSVAAKQSGCDYQTSTPIDFNLQLDVGNLAVQEMIARVRTLPKTSAEASEQMRIYNELLSLDTTTSTSVDLPECSPIVKESLKKVGKSSKKGAEAVLTAILINIV